MGLTSTVAAIAAANLLSPGQAVPAVLVVSVPVAVDPVLTSARLRRPVVYIQAPPAPVARDNDAFSMRTVAPVTRKPEFIPSFERGPGEPLWSPVFSSMEIGRMSARRSGGNPLRSIFAFTVTDQYSEPSLGGIAGTLWRISGSAH